MRVLVGIVGETPVVDEYPLGPRFAARLRSANWRGADVTVANMAWGALHIVQGLEHEAVRYDRAVLIGAVQRGGRPGQIVLGRWIGGAMDPAALQERIYEAVTGIVSLENLLMIGEHFHVWPGDLTTVEVELPISLFGDMVLATSGGRAPCGTSLGFDPAALIERLVDGAADAILNGAHAPGREVRSAGSLAPLRPFLNVVSGAVAQG
jgi:hypothetical protein